MVGSGVRSGAAWLVITLAASTVPDAPDGRGVAIGRDASGCVVITGDGNTVNQCQCGVGEMRSVEQKLFEAWQRGTGAHLSTEDVRRLVNPDDAIRARISNVACEEAGVDVAGYDAMRPGENWQQFKDRLREDYESEEGGK